MVFITNKYSRAYFKIIDRAKLRSVIGYKETHHIIPCSLGGDNSPGNLVDLTAKEHYIVHLLLPHMVVNSIHKKKMWAALRCMSKLVSGIHKRYVGSARFYERAKENIDFGIGNRGRKQSAEEKQKRANSLKGHKVSTETRKKIGDANRGRKLPPVSIETRIKIGEASKGRILSDESKKKLSESSKRRGHNGFKGKGSRGPKPIETLEKFQETISNRTPDWSMKPRAQLTCPHCGKQGDVSGMKRYHFNNCKAFSDSSSTR